MLAATVRSPVLHHGKTQTSNHDQARPYEKSQRAFAALAIPLLLGRPTENMPQEGVFQDMGLEVARSGSAYGSMRKP